MRVTECLVEQAIRTDLQGGDRDAVLGEMVDAFVDAGIIAADKGPGGEESPRDRVLQSVVRREELGGTALGRGIAVPHGKSAVITQVYVAIGLVKRDGVTFQGGGKPEVVSVVFLVLAPLDSPGEYLRALEAISRMLRNEMFRKHLSGATTSQDVVQLVEEYQQGVPC